MDVIFKKVQMSRIEKNSSGWNSSDVGDALVLLTAVLGAIFVIAIL